MAQKYMKGTDSTVHRIDLACEQTGFSTPPFDVHIKFLPATPPLRGWTLLAHAAAGKPDLLAKWLGAHPGIERVRVEPGLAPKLLRASVRDLPRLWASAAGFVTVHHLDLASDGHASWFIAGARDKVLAFVNDLEAQEVRPLESTEVRCRPVHRASSQAPISRRQFEALSTAVAMGYYEIPHRLDLRALAAMTGFSLGALSELLRRAEAAILTHYVDSSLMGWPVEGEEPPNPFRPVEALLEPVVPAHARGGGKGAVDGEARGPPPRDGQHREWPFIAR